ncbi:MAG: LCP family protein [Coprobacillus sp.]
MAIMDTDKKKGVLTYISIVLLIIAIVIAINVYQKDNNNYVYESKDDYHTIQYNKQEYNYDTSIVSILFLGIDSKDDSQGQSDVMQLVLLDRSEKKIKVIGLSRDIMTDIKQFDVRGNDLGWSKQHLNLAYAYGTTSEMGCMLSTSAISKLFKDIPIAHYAAMQLNELTTFANIVGPLDIVIPNNSLVAFQPSWKKGTKVTITDSNVEDYLRTRSTDEQFSNNDRMQRHKEYITKYFQKLKKLLNEDKNGTIKKVFDKSQSLTTNIGYTDLQNFANMILEYDFDPEVDYYLLDGENVSGIVHDEFVVNQDSLQTLIIDLFYEKGR